MTGKEMASQHALQSTKRAMLLVRIGFTAIRLALTQVRLEYSGSDPSRNRRLINEANACKRSIAADIRERERVAWRMKHRVWES